jgi:hypothetical protein
MLQPSLFEDLSKRMRAEPWKLDLCPPDWRFILSWAVMAGIAIWHLNYQIKLLLNPILLDFAGFVGFPAVNIIFACFLIVLTVCVAALEYPRREHVLITDEYILVGFKSDKSSQVYWHDVGFVFDLPGGFRLVRKTSGGFVVIPPIQSYSDDELEDVLDLVHLLKGYISKCSPSVAEAMEKFQADRAGLGIVFPSLDSGWHTKQERLLQAVIYGVSMTGWLTTVGCVTKLGAMVGLVGLVITLCLVAYVGLPRKDYGKLRLTDTTLNVIQNGVASFPIDLIQMKADFQSLEETSFDKKYDRVLDIRMYGKDGRILNKILFPDILPTTEIDQAPAWAKPATS